MASARYAIFAILSKFVLLIMGYSTNQLGCSFFPLKDVYIDALNEPLLMI